MEWLRRKTDPVSIELDRAKQVWKRWPTDEYLNRVITYLELAKECGLWNTGAVLSCQDLAGLVSPEIQSRNQSKIDAWRQVAAGYFAVPRPQRVLAMQLDPEYFIAILMGKKQYEGRAYDPRSPKRYADLRPTDEVIFTVNKDQPNEDECRKWGVDPNWCMRAQIEEINFAPSVHYMFQYLPGIDVGAEFQPFKTGMAELVQLGRAATYYSFPEYPKKIQTHGFLGIKLNCQGLASLTAYS